MQNLYFLGGNGDGTTGNSVIGQSLGPNNVDEFHDYNQNDAASRNAAAAALANHSFHQFGAPTLSSIPSMLSQQQQQAVIAAQAAAAMAERSLTGGFTTGPPNNPAFLDPSRADICDPYGNPHNLIPQGPSFLENENGSSNQLAAKLMDANRLLLQHLQHISQHQPNASFDAVAAAPSPALWNNNFGLNAALGNQPTALMAAPPITAAPPAAAMAASANSPSTFLANDVYSENGLLGPWSTTSAGLLGKLASTGENNGGKKRVVRKKPKDKPKRPLSAYNIFFKEERARILESIPSNDSQQPAAPKDEQQDQRSKKRKKIPHGKIGFENLAKVIGQRWQDLEPSKVDYYKEKAAEDMKRYKNEMEIFLTKQEEQRKRAESDHGSSENTGEDDASSKNNGDGDLGKPKASQGGIVDNDDEQARPSKKVKLQNDEEEGVNEDILN